MCQYSLFFMLNYIPLYLCTHFVYPFTLDGNPQLSFFWERTLFFFPFYVGFSHTTTHISHNYTYVPSLASLSSPIPSLQVITEHQVGSLSYKAASHQPPILHLIVYIWWCYFLHLFHSPPPLLCPQVHSLHLHLHSFPENRFINSIFLDFIHMC